MIVGYFIYIFIRMKAKATNLIIIIVILHALCNAVAGLLNIEHAVYPVTIAYLLNFVIGGTYVIPLLYLRSFLVYINEKRGIILAFWIYIIYYVLSLLLRTFVAGISMLYGNWFFTLVSVVITLYFLIKILQIRNSELSKPFKLYAFAIILSAIIRIILPILMIQYYTGKHMLRYLVAAELLPSLALLFILYKTSVYLNDEQRAFKRAAANSDEPA